MAQVLYTPGVCNIGPEEIARRRNMGWIGLAVAIVLFGILYWTGVNHWWRLFIFLPLMLSASGFLQAHFGFCAGFARQGVFNFGPLGRVDQVQDEGSKAKDRAKGNQISVYAAIIAFVVTVAAVLI